MNQLPPINLLDLPDEILLGILTLLPLSYIKPVRQTCSRLYQISQFKEIWEKQHFLFYFSSFYEEEEEEMLNWLMKIDPPYLNLEINFHRTDMTDEVVSKVADLIRVLGPKIGSLCMYGIQNEVPSELIEDIMLTCVDLKKLNLSGEHLITWPEVDRIKLEHTHTKLEILELSLNLDSQTFMSVIDLFLNFYPYITTFKAYYYPDYNNQTTDKILAQLYEFLVDKITATNKSIKTFKFISRNHNRIGGIGAIKLASSGLRLRSIELSNEHQLSKAEFKRVFSNQNNLREIRIEDCENFDGECLRCLTAYCPKLERLYLYSALFYHQLEVRIAEVQTNLKVLVLEGVNFVTGSTMDLQFPNLERVKLNNCSIKDGVICFQFLENCRLRDLEIEESECLQDADILRIIFASKNTLVKLSIIESKQFSDLEMTSNVHLPKLESLCINASEKLTHAVVNNLEFHWLKFISISSFEVDEQRFKMMVTNCPLLEDVYLKFDDKIDNHTLLELSKGFYFLRSLHNFTNIFGRLGEKRIFSNRKYQR